MTTLLPSSTTPTTPAPPRQARLAVYLVFALCGGLVGSWVPRIPEVKARLHLSAGSLGLALLALAVGSLISLPIAGQLISRFGSAVITRCSLVLFCVLAVLPGLSTTLWALWVLLLGWGFAMGSLDVAMNAQAVCVEKAYRRPLMSGFHAWWSVGSLLGAGAGSLGIALGVGICWQQLALAGVLVVAASIATTALIDEPAAPTAPPRVTRPALRQRLFGTLDRRLVLLGLAGMTAMLCEGSVGDWTPTLLRDSLHAPASHVGLAYAGFMTMETLGRLIGDRIILTLGRVRAIVSMSAIGVGGLTVGLATGTIVGAIAGFTLLGVGLAITVPVAFSAAADGRANAGPALAAVSSLSYTGFLAGPSAIGVVAQFVSLPAALWLVPVITAVGAALAVLAIRAPTTPTR